MLNGLELQVVTLDGKVTEDDLLRHDEQKDDPSLAYMLTRMTYPEFPEPMGVFRCVERPTYEDMLMEQIEESVRVRGKGELENLFDNGETWVVSGIREGTFFAYQQNMLQQFLPYGKIRS